MNRVALTIWPRHRACPDDSDTGILSMGERRSYRRPPMPVTVVQCSQPGCRAEATYKVASPWQEGTFSEMQTLGYCCPAHVEKVVAFVSLRLKPGQQGHREIRISNLPRE